MKGTDNFSFCGSSLNDINLYLKQKNAWIHRRKMLDSLCSCSCIVPFGHEIQQLHYLDLPTDVYKQRLKAIHNYSVHDKIASLFLSPFPQFLTDFKCQEYQVVMGEKPCEKKFSLTVF